MINKVPRINAQNLTINLIFGHRDDLSYSIHLRVSESGHPGITNIAPQRIAFTTSGLNRLEELIVAVELKVQKGDT